ncbi:PH domain-containing protein [Jatrophihabitans lederbergiae]|uniref:PH domain-containing protein n=1 Tax=Jatrophihabitans lederbergiae TaxID=3075547 RepID=A0ABU2JB21_9ACTN|nr:PH domain-containing protein [Jatrophihabitans sp. DSM 44399]MDT0261928.1 PH domain-containing protein [Jatrophihabitans sp. DSM 44399]
MPYPDKLLADDEEIVEHLHPHWLTVAPAVAAFIVICAAAGVGIALAPRAGDASQVVLPLVLVGALVLLLWLTLAPVIRRQSTHYVITTRRVLIRRGVLRHVGRDIMLGRITDVGYEQTLADRIVRSGTLHIESAGENGQETLVDIPHANQVQQTLNRLIADDSGWRQHYRPRD